MNDDDSDRPELPSLQRAGRRADENYERTPTGGIMVGDERIDVRDLVIGHHQRLKAIERDLNAIAENVRILSENALKQQGAATAIKSQKDWLKPIITSLVLLAIGWIGAHLTTAVPQSGSSTDDVARAVVRAMREVKPPAEPVEP